MAKMGRPKSENAKKKTLSIRVEDALYERICNYAEQHQLTVTEVVLQGLDKKKKTDCNRSCLAGAGQSFVRP